MTGIPGATIEHMEQTNDRAEKADAELAKAHGDHSLTKVKLDNQEKDNVILREQRDQLRDEVQAKQHAIDAAAAQIAQLSAEVERLKEENRGLRAGKPIGAVVGAMTIVEQERTIQDLRAQLAAATASLADAHQALRFASGLLEEYGTPGAEMFRQECRAAIDAARAEKDRSHD